ncbi:hypothetical protein CXG81DRAFT_12477 [Caulochytrium protostelioides]|uniref:acetyl-CoA C-acetyltransferase n=1 Tax=Caulochytrium protostelioides TaxID=1555241 RepID=A0A4P9WYJ7_9FUNG|nr:thiolase [Caulochytrium protostelioides]RKP01053.1 hypothetical protein CXG81DRAFT_12477 [Caulochytrium protostelioides]|eukprot:RKP01053.1 hypothetical protein CXG81DRAFT_12477 [Caulochytrium protostelioides]
MPVYILSAQRTPLGRLGGNLSALAATDLGAIAIRAAVAKSGVQPEQIQACYMGNVLQANQGQNPARIAAIKAGLAPTTVSTSINKVCASGMKAVTLAASELLIGQYDVVVAGGMESMSNTPYYLPQQRFGSKYGHVETKDGILTDGLTDAFSQDLMGHAAELCASKYEITRDAQDADALRSYDRALEAQKTGAFDSEIVPVPLPSRGGVPTVVATDEQPGKLLRDKFPTLKPAFLRPGQDPKTATVTAGNASPLSDGAAALVLVSERFYQAHLTPQQRADAVLLAGWADAEQAPEWFTTTPAKALPLAVAHAAKHVTALEEVDAADLGKAIDLFEINEAFAAVGCANRQILGLDPAQVNVHGGAVALGHPLGCSGARILVTLIHALRRRQQSLGAAAVCNGGGGASAVVLQIVKS